MKSGLRIGICRIMHEANGFSPVEVDRACFEKIGGILAGKELMRYEGCNDEIQGFVRVLESAEWDIEIIPMISASGFAGGYIAAGLVAYLEQQLRRMLREAGPLDGMLFALHGSMASAKIHDLEAFFLRIVREEKGNTMPVVCTFDFHAVMTREIITLSSAVLAYHTHPHVDIVQTGERAANVLLAMLDGKIDPVVAWQKIPLLTPPPDDGTNSGPLKELADRMHDINAIEGVVDCSLYCSYCWLDVPEQGWSVTVVTDADPELGGRFARELASMVWEKREGLLPEEMLPPAEAVRAAAAIDGFPIVITDSADTFGAGCPGDTTELVQALLSEGSEIDGLLLAHLVDAGAVAEIAAAGEGSSVTLDVGGKGDSRFSKPLRIQGKVLGVTDGVIEDVGKFGSTPFLDAGTTACLGIGNVRLVLTERITLGPQPSLFRKVGIEPFEAKIVTLKTGVGYKVTFGQAAKAVIRADCPGAASYNLSNYTFSHSGDGLYPLDPDLSWSAE